MELNHFRRFVGFNLDLGTGTCKQGTKVVSLYLRIRTNELTSFWTGIYKHKLLILDLRTQPCTLGFVDSDFFILTCLVDLNLH